MRKKTTNLIIMGALLIFASSCKKDDTPEFTDPRDGNVYKTVTIGAQTWMAENLRYLPSVVGPDIESLTTPYYYVYGYGGTVVADAKLTNYYTNYGVLYNWPAAMNGGISSRTNPSGVQGVCPAGWHLPSDAEWEELTDYLGGDSVAGGKLKDTTLWEQPNTGATNETGFSALPGGVRQGNNGFFVGFGTNGEWWSATEDDWNVSYAGSIFMHKNSSGGLMGYYLKNFGYSVRCVKD